LLPLAGVQAARQKYIEPSDMTPKEKEAAILTLQRFARGVHEKKIQKEAIDDVVKPVAELMPNGRWKLKDKPTRMEIDQFLENAKAKADDAMIPNEPFDLNIADELKKAIHGV
jgi:predicted acetyltransferase